jgi:N-acetylglucosamine kinase-like BadF-type ATPase
MTPGFLGIDIGGTASRWVLVGDDGAVLARGSAGGATGHLFAVAERTRFTQVIGEIAASNSTPIATVHAGVTGLGPQAFHEARALVAAQFGIEPDAVGVSDDMELAFHACFAPGEGHLVAAGTGSIGLHLTAAGEAIRVGGRGLLIDDGGSGTWIALTALDRLYRRIDETGLPGEAQVLADALYGAIGGSDWDAVRSFVYGSDRGRIGTLAQAVAEAATAGDPLALEILADAGTELARLARALLRRGGIRPIAFIGGIIALHPAIATALAAALPGNELRYPRIDAALHAAQMAQESFSRT